MILYNEFDPKVVSWLRELISAGHIRQGVVNAQSIKDLRAEDCKETSHFFAGIGGWDLALKLAGWPSHIPVWTGSCPCQPFSAAGKRKGTDDERHLWPEFLRLIAKCRPAIVFGEQVASKDGRIWLAGVRSDLEALGYAVGAADLCAAGIGAPHIRQRLYWVAIANGAGQPANSRGGESDNGYEKGNDLGRGGAIGGLGYAIEPRLERHARNVGNGSEPGRNHSHPSGSTTETSGPDGLEEPIGFGWRGRDNGNPPGNDRALQAQGRSPAGAWGDAVFVPCRDGKARRIKSGLEPLANGIPGRVVRLRGYGNAIVPALAAEFIKASMEAMGI